MFGGWWNKENGPPRPAPVTLHVYDLGPTVANVNMLLGAVGTGAFHAGVEVYGTEWSFGCGREGPYGSGIFCVPPKGCEAHVYREAVAMGDTRLSKREVDKLIDQLAREWPGKDYDLLRHNCCHFSDEFCKRLGVDRVPGWVLSLAGVGAMLRSAVRIGGAAAVNAAAVAVDLPARGAAAVRDGAVLAAAAIPAALADEEGEKPARDRANTQRPTNSPFQCQMPASNLKDFNDGAALPQYAPDPEVAGRGVKAGGGGGNADLEYVTGETVEVYSNSHGAWCRGTVESVQNGEVATIAFLIPGGNPNEFATKVLPFTHKDLRKLTNGNAGDRSKRTTTPPAGSKRATTPTSSFKKNDLVDIYSNSKQAWCPGYVEAVHDRCVRVAFQLPGFPDGDLAVKDLPGDHKDLRRRTNSRPPLPPDESETQAVADMDAAQGRDTHTPGPCEDSDQRTYKVGDWVEVFTNTHQIWCVGRVTQADASRIHVVFQLPGAGHDDWVVKKLAVGCRELRRTNVELPSSLQIPVFNSSEQAAYGRYFRELCSAAGEEGSGNPPMVRDTLMAEYLKRSGLPRRALKEIWQVANPTGMASLRLEEFSMCCRLIGHCQSKTWDRMDLIEQGGDELRRALEDDALQRPPPALPDFKAHDQI